MNIYPDNELLNASNLSLKNIDYNKKLLFSKKDIISNVAKWSIRQSPKNIPDDLINVLTKLDDHLNMYFNKLTDIDMGFMEMNYNELYNFIKGNLITIKEFKKWNLSEMEKSINIDINDDRGEYCNQFISLYSDIDPYYDFIDLDALIRNVSTDIYYSND